MSYPSCAIALLPLAVLSSCGADDGADIEDTLLACEFTEETEAQSLPLVTSTMVATIVPGAARGDQPGALNPSTEEGEAAYIDLGYGAYSQGPGNAHALRTDLASPLPGTRKSLAYFVHLSDPQLADDESPIRFGNLDNPVFGGGLRPQEAYVGQTISAFNRTLARVEDKGRSFDFGVITGDCIDSAQYNELRWFIDIMDGQMGVETDSGEDNDPVVGVDDPKDPFDAAAFPAPWYFVFGNHDVQVVGTSLIEDSAGVETGATTILGTRDYRLWGAPVVNDPIPPDEDRRFVSRDEIIAELQNTAELPGPIGHGFAAGADTSLGANYISDVIPGLLRLISVDSNDLTGGGSYGMITRERLEGFLLPALQAAEDDGVLVMVAMHHPSDRIDEREGESGDVLPNAISPDELEESLAAYPNVILSLVGHTHDNRARAIEGIDAEHPGYWELTTSAIADWPIQVRVVELVDNGDQTLSIFATLVDYDETSCLERRFRRLSLIDFLAGWSDGVSRDPLNLNVELVVPIPSSATAAVAAAAASAPEKIESLTTLAD